MKPMLAHKFVDHKHKIQYPTWIQPKLNGVRGIYMGGRFQSRDEFLWHPSVVEHIVEELQLVVADHIILDGEFYVHGWSLQKINRAISVVRSKSHELTPEVEYHIFDCIDTSQPHLTFEQRVRFLESICERLVYRRIKKVKVVRSYKATLAEAEASYTLYKQAGYEGLMYRKPDAPYGFEQECGNKENRWTYLLKRKDWLDDDFKIIDFTETTGEKGHRGFYVTCITQEGKHFKVGSGLDTSELDYYILNPPIGQTAKVKYEMLSDDGIPLKPTLEAIV